MSWPLPISGGRRITRDTPSLATASDRATGPGSVGGTRPLPAASTTVAATSRLVAKPSARM